jgi:hypothetical protein
MRGDTEENPQITKRKAGKKIMMRLPKQLVRVFIEASTIFIFIFLFDLTA